MDLRTDSRRIPPRSKGSMIIDGTENLPTQPEIAEEDVLFFGYNPKLDYSLSVTASEIYRLNYINNKTIAKSEKTKQWIPSNHEHWFQLRTKIQTMLTGLNSSIFVENISDAKEAGDFFRTAKD